MVDVHTAKQRSYNMSRIRGRDTKPEKIMRSLVSDEGHRYRSNVRALPGKPDIVLPAFETAIFVHGCFWHRHPGCRYATTPKSNSDFWQAKFIRTLERDRQHLKALRKAKWRVLVIWECELRDKPSQVRSKLTRAIKARRTRRSRPKSS